MHALWVDPWSGPKVYKAMPALLTRIVPALVEAVLTVSPALLEEPVDVPALEALDVVVGRVVVAAELLEDPHAAAASPKSESAPTTSTPRARAEACWRAVPSRRQLLLVVSRWSIICGSLGRELVCPRGGSCPRIPVGPAQGYG
jgi:hypothetical protein